MSSLVTDVDDQYVIDDPEIAERVNRYVDWENLPRKHFIRMVEQGRLGLNLGLRNGLKDINKYIYGTQVGYYYLIGADSKVGKTSLADFMFVLNAYEDCLREGRKLYLYYFSFEISKAQKYLKWVSYYLFLKFGLILPGSYISGKVRKDGIILPVTDEHMKMIRVAYAYVEKLMSSIVFIEDPMTPTGIWVEMLKHYKTIGVIDQEKPSEHSKYGRIKGFEFNEGEERSVTMGVIDHGALLATERGFDTKKTMDQLSKYIVAMRNIFDMTWIFVQQFNNELTSVNRDTWKKVTENSIMPQRLDFGDSTYPFRDADVVFGLVGPFRFDMKVYREYDITRFREFLIILSLMKNRYGEGDTWLPIFFNPIAGHFFDVPEPKRANAPGGDPLAPFYNKINQIQECQKYYQVSQ